MFSGFQVEKKRFYKILVPGFFFYTELSFVKEEVKIFTCDSHTFLEHRVL